MANELARRLADELNDQLLRNTIDQAELGDAVEAQLRTWASTNSGRVRNLVAAELPKLPALADAIPVQVPDDAWRPTATLGPATITVDCPIATVTVAGARIPIGLLPPDGAAIAIDAGAARGAGSLSIDGTRFRGSLALRLGVADVIAFAELDTAGSAPALTLVLGVRFVPPVQLSFGFALTAVGGVIGVNRRLDIDALRGRLADGSALDALFPADPKASAPAVLATLGELFRTAPGQHVVGPTVTITWLDLGAFSVVRLDLGVLLSLPSAVVAIVGRGQIQLPPVLQIRLDVLGVIDPGRSLVSIDAVLVDSHLLGIFDVTGTAALRMCWGENPYLVLTVGGFYPGFRPEPALLPPQQRLALNLAVPCPLTLRADGYLAITANTVQAGAHLEAAIDLALIRASGSLSFDSIVTFDPFHIHADYSAEWSVEVAIFEGGTTVSGWLDGPGPWKVHARVSISLLIDSFDWSDTFTFGSQGTPPPPAFATISQAIEPVLRGPTRFAAARVDDPLVDVRPLPGAPGTVLASPLGVLTWTQDVVPLGLEVTRVGGRRLASPQTAHVAIAGDGVDVGDDAEGWFAPTVYTDLSAAETLGQPTYQHLAAGKSVTLAPKSDGLWTGSLDYVEYFRRGRTPEDWLLGMDAAKAFLAFDDLVVQGVAAQTARPTTKNRSAQVTVRDERWAVTPEGGEPSPATSAIHGLLASRGTDAVLHAAAEGPIEITLGAI